MYFSFSFFTDKVIKSVNYNESVPPKNICTYKLQNFKEPTFLTSNSNSKYFIFLIFCLPEIKVIQCVLFTLVAEFSVSVLSKYSFFK